MKLQILELDPHDDHVSARDKIARVKADRVLLVWPRRGRILHRRLDLVLLHREADGRGLQLGLLSHDPQVRDHAASLGIPLFDSLDELPERRWRAYRPPNRPERRAAEEEENHWPAERRRPRAGGAAPPRWLRGPLLALVALSLLAVAAVLLPSATLVVQPEISSRSDQLVIDLAAVGEPTRADPGPLPVNRLETTVSVSQRRETSGLVTVPDARASGSLRFTNLSDREVQIPAGTSVRASTSSAPRFLTIETARLPAERGSQIEVAAEAAAPGQGGNVPAQAIDTVDGLLGLEVAVANVEPFQGGGESLAPAVSVHDRQELHQQALERALALALEQLAEGTGTGELLIEESSQIEEVVSARYDEEPGQVAASLGYELTAIVSAYSYRQEELERLVQGRIEAETAETGLNVVPESLEVESTSYLPPGGSQPAELLVTASWRSFRPPPYSMRAAVAGQRPADVVPLLEPFPVRLVGLQQQPPWFPRLPWVVTRIQVVYPWQVE